MPNDGGKKYLPLKITNGNGTSNHVFEISQWNSML